MTEDELAAAGWVRTPETLDVAGLRREIEALPDVNPTPTVDTGTATDWPMVKRADVLRLTRQARERELVDPSGKDPTPRFHDTYLAAPVADTAGIDAAHEPSIETSGSYEIDAAWLVCRCGWDANKSKLDWAGHLAAALRTPKPEGEPE